MINDNIKITPQYANLFDLFLICLKYPYTIINNNQSTNRIILTRLDLFIIRILTMKMLDWI